MANTINKKFLNSAVEYLRANGGKEGPIIRELLDNYKANSYKDETNAKAAVRCRKVLQFIMTEGFKTHEFGIRNAKKEFTCVLEFLAQLQGSHLAGIEYKGSNKNIKQFIAENKGGDSMFNKKDNGVFAESVDNTLKFLDENMQALKFLKDEAYAQSNQETAINIEKTLERYNNIREGVDELHNTVADRQRDVLGILDKVCRAAVANRTSIVEGQYAANLISGVDSPLTTMDRLVSDAKKMYQTASGSRSSVRDTDIIAYRKQEKFLRVNKVVAQRTTYRELVNSIQRLLDNTGSSSTLAQLLEKQEAQLAKAKTEAEALIRRRDNGEISAEEYKLKAPMYVMKIKNLTASIAGQTRNLTMTETASVGKQMIWDSVYSVIVGFVETSTPLMYSNFADDINNALLNVLSTINGSNGSVLNLDEAKRCVEMLNRLNVDIARRQQEITKEFMAEQQAVTDYVSQFVFGDGQAQEEGDEDDLEAILYGSKKKAVEQRPDLIRKDNFDDDDD